MKRLIVLAAMLACSASAYGTSDRPTEVEKDACEWLTRISGLRPLDSRTAVLFAPGGKPAYVVTLSVPLPELEHAIRYAYIDRDRDGRICGRSMDAIAVPNDPLRMSSRIMAMTPLDAESIRALEEKFQVKLAKRNRQANEAANEAEIGTAEQFESPANTHE